MGRPQKQTAEILVPANQRDIAALAITHELALIAQDGWCAHHG